MESTNEYYSKRDESFATKALHRGSNPEQWTSKAVVPPITMTTTFVQDEPGVFAFCYSRMGNPSRQVLEQCIAALEGSKYGLCFSAGLGAVSTVVALLNAGDHVVCVENCYGGTGRYFNDIAPTKNIKTTFIDGTDVDKFCAGVQQNTKMMWIESVTNPLLQVIDIKKISSFAHSFNKDILVVVDNTFLTPYFLKPLELGADIVVYSCSKYMNGHSDVTMGAVLVNDDNIYKRIHFLQEYCGAVPSPFDCYLVTRGLKTLQLRMDQHMKNGLAVAKFLESHSMVEKVIYPGLDSHPQRELIKRTWTGCSGICSFYIKGGLKETKIFVKSLKVFTVAASLGGCESLAGLPVLMIPMLLPEQERKKFELTDNLIRLSVGLESTQDLLNDLDQALKSIKSLGEGLLSNKIPTLSVHN